MLLINRNQESIVNFFGAIRSKLGNNYEDDDDLQLHWGCHPDEHEHWNDSTIENSTQLRTDKTQQADHSDLCKLGSVGEVVSRR